LISCGAVLENIKIAAASFGINSEIEYKISEKENDLVASVRLVPNRIEKDPLSDFIWERHTNRKFYKKISIAPPMLQSIKASVDMIPGASLHFITERDKLKKIAKIIYKIDRIRTEHRPLHEHLMKMIRFTDQEALEKKDGLPLKNLEGGLAGEAFLKITRSWRVMNLANTLGLGRMVAFHSYQGIANSSGVALLTMDGMDEQAFIAGGQALERTWLKLTSLGMMMQPMTAITLFFLRCKLEAGNGFSPRHQKVLASVEKDYEQIFPVLTKDNIGQVMLFRFGYADNIRVRTLRR
jgi:hypothetical protein